MQETKLCFEYSYMLCCEEQYEVVLDPLANYIIFNQAQVFEWLCMYLKFCYI